MDFLPFLLMAGLTFLRFLDRTDSQLHVEPAPPPPPLKTPPRPCPFCGGESRYFWLASPGGGHRLQCVKCADVYTVNLGGSTRWAIVAASTASELCWAESPATAQTFIDQALSRLTPNTRFEIQLGADETSPYCLEYLHAFNQTMKQAQGKPPEIRH